MNRAKQTDLPGVALLPKIYGSAVLSDVCIHAQLSQLANSGTGHAAVKVDTILVQELHGWTALDLLVQNDSRFLVLLMCAAATQPTI